MAPFDFDESNPPDDGVVSQFPANERASRDAIRGAFELEHDEATGHHNLPGGTDAQRNAILDWVINSLWIKTDVSPAQLQRVVSLGPVVWEALGSDFASGTRMVFDQNAAPTGWTRQNITGERLIKLADSGDTGQAEAGSWTISGVTVDNHALSAAEMPAHTHSYQDYASSGNQFSISGGSSTILDNVGGQTTGSSGGGAAHSHGLTADGTWRPAHRILIIASKD